MNFDLLLGQSLQEKDAGCLKLSIWGGNVNYDLSNQGSASQDVRRSTT